MKKQTIVAGVLGLAMGVCGACATAYADGDVIAARKAMMKNVGASMRVVGAMMKGATEFDAVAAELAMRTMNSSAHGFALAFPEGSEKGGDTEAAPAIWSDMDGFNAAVQKFAGDTMAAVDAAKQGEDAFKAAFGAVASNCKGCHEKFRIKK